VSVTEEDGHGNDANPIRGGRSLAQVGRAPEQIPSIGDLLAREAVFVAWPGQRIVGVAASTPNL
jgi:hypothetical protein